MRKLTWITVLPLCLILLTVFGCSNPPEATAAAKETEADAVDEFGVPLGDTPPPMPPGYASQDEVMAAALQGKLEIFMPGSPIPLPEGVVETKGIEYGKGGDKALLLDLYTLDNLDKPVPGLIFIHGGGWEKGERGDYKYYTVRYAKRGYVAATISYRLSHEAQFPSAVQDVKCAVRWMRANAEKLHVDPNRIALVGGSAGGHLAMMVGYTAGMPEFEGNGGHAGVSSAVQAVVNLYGPIDIMCEEGRGRSGVTKFLGTTYDKDPAVFAMASPVTYLSKDDPPTLVLHGTIDELVPIWQSDQLVEKLKELGVPVVYDRFEGWPHTMDLAIPVTRRVQWQMNRFFDTYLSAAN
ncbi:MAG: alpha/beta hydrolase fold domain-containing protein [Nitrospiraceae bacterium]|nr:alpha/beta hydrolase fold domain-containing protein [Nitrospiraceae bacterium]